MAGGQQFPEQYTVPQLARIFHKFPHFNVSIHIVNNTFNPHSEIYLESLGILGSIPAALLILTLLVLLVYLVTRCCDRKPRHRRSISLLKYCLAVLALLCCGTVAVGLYGNDDVHNGIEQLVAAAKNIDGSVASVRNQTEAIELMLKGKVQNDLMALNDQFDEPVSNKTMMDALVQALNSFKQNMSSAMNRTFEIKKPLSGISLVGAISFTETVEQLRWPVTMSVLSVLLILCVVLLVGVARHSRCALITFSVFGLFAVIISWLMASLYLASSVALGDLCVSPDSYISKTAPSTVAAEVFIYYTHCESGRTNPFMYQMREAKQATDHMRRSLELVKQLANYLFKDEKLLSRLTSLTNDISTVDKHFASLASLTSFIDCKPLHKQYVHAAKSLCHLGLFGLTLMLLASIAAGFFFTVLVWVDSHTWIYIRKRNDYHQVNEQDPYLPPSAASQAIAARTLRGQGSYPPTAPPLNPNALGNHTIKQPLLLTPPPPSYATATARARQMHESMSKGGGINGSGTGDHKSSQHNQQTSGRAEHRAGLGDQPGQYATLSKQCKTLESSDFY
ncbi:PREDICTED: protein tweety [Ceratosolen solmsi marchali]|uniref:Protein tweety homolog n=1 Tax=Ceratosolen solmsi marchali TaxID=326594 RepID=A0AAJ6YL03_9HYME|nr:PREDICTED: protein tweety [Ceratosolen solmsi marchali]